MIKEWSNFYTPKHVAKMIIEMIPKEYIPQAVIDICAGSGNFLDVATEKWEVDAIGIDIQRSALLSNKKHKIYIQDALDISNLKKVTPRKKKLVLANPPFGKFDGEITAICVKHSYLQKIAIRSKRIETNMIVSNMSLLEDGEIFAAILPENIFSSEKLAEFKRVFLSYFNPIFIGDSKKYFPGSEVKTRVFIGTYLSFPIQNDIRDKENPNIQDFKIIRGIDNSKIFKDIQNFDRTKFRRIIHFNNTEGIIHSKCYISKKHKTSWTVAKNDILISRVGRNSGRVFLASSSYIGKPFSDYFFVVKDFPAVLDQDFTTKLENHLLKKRKGLTARYICKQDVEEALLNL